MVLMAPARASCRIGSGTRSVQLGLGGGTYQSRRMREQRASTAAVVRNHPDGEDSEIRNHHDGDVIGWRYDHRRSWWIVKRARHREPAQW